MNLEFLNVQNFIERAKGKGCLVIGDIILDKYIYGEVGRISPEAPIPVVKATKEKGVLGGAANVAGNIGGYHIKTYLCGLLGDDECALEVQELLKGRGITFCGIISKNRCTTVKTRVVGMGQQLVRIDKEDAVMMDSLEEQQLIAKVKGVISDVQLVVLSDYNKGVCSDTFCKEIISMCNQAGICVVVDPKSNDWSKYMGAYLITPNFKEFLEITGGKFENTEENISNEANSVLDKYSLQQILVTRSQYGMTLVRKNGETMTFRSTQREVYDVSGAGDTVLATIAALITAGFGLEDSLETASYAAGLAVSKSGTYMVTLEEVVAYAGGLGMWYGDKIWNLDRLTLMLQLWKESEEKIVFTNGCFDILHVGHIDYLNCARMMGSKMIVGLNTDASVKRLKGDLRPINNQDARALALSALQCVDAVVLFDEDTPEKLIERIRPAVLVKGGDYKLENIVGRQYADETYTIPLTEGYSTTGLIERIQNGE